MKKNNKLIISDQQRIETAKMLLGICQVFLLAIVAGPYISPIAKKLTFWDNVYGLINSLIIYIISMILLKRKEKK